MKARFSPQAQTDAMSRIEAALRRERTSNPFREAGPSRHVAPGVVEPKTIELAEVLAYELQVLETAPKAALELLELTDLEGVGLQLKPDVREAAGMIDMVQLHGDQHPETAATLAEALLRAVDAGTLVLPSPEQRDALRAVAVDARDRSYLQALTRQPRGNSEWVDVKARVPQPTVRPNPSQGARQGTKVQYRREDIPDPVLDEHFRCVDALTHADRLKLDEAVGRAVAGVKALSERLLGRPVDVDFRVMLHVDAARRANGVSVKWADGCCTVRLATHRLSRAPTLGVAMTIAHELIHAVLSAASC